MNSFSLTEVGKRRKTVKCLSVLGAVMIVGEWGWGVSSKWTRVPSAQNGSAGGGHEGEVSHRVRAALLDDEARGRRAVSSGSALGGVSRKRRLQRQVTLEQRCPAGLVESWVDSTWLGIPRQRRSPALEATEPRKRCWGCSPCLDTRLQDLQWVLI